MTDNRTDAPFRGVQLPLLPPSKIVLRLTMTLDGPSNEASCYIERFDGEVPEHVSTLVPAPFDLARAHLEANDLLLDEYQRALDDLAPF